MSPHCNHQREWCFQRSSPNFLAQMPQRDALSSFLHVDTGTPGTTLGPDRADCGQLYRAGNERLSAMLEAWREEIGVANLRGSRGKFGNGLECELIRCVCHVAPCCVETPRSSKIG
ncbi:hypothetical protein KRP22_009345 [Phytophthora ramorum]|nr:hypothetical protein KRP22_8176 [Phytophthora ramorum]